MCSAIKCPVWHVDAVSCLAISSSLHQTHLSVKSHRPKRKSHRPSRKPSWYAAALPARPYTCPCLTPVLRCLAQRIFMSIYQSSTKVSEAKEKAVQPCIKEKDYPSAEDRTVDHRTTRGCRRTYTYMDMVRLAPQRHTGGK